MVGLQFYMGGLVKSEKLVFVVVILILGGLNSPLVVDMCIVIEGMMVE